MNRLAVLSTDNNPDYFFYAPIVEWAWNRFGWDVALFVTSDVNVEEIGLRNPTTQVFRIPDIEGVRTCTLAQTVRHFVANVLPRDTYVMVQDIDLIPLRSWEPNLSERTIYGWELTGRSFIPVHYTGMTGEKWYELMDCTGDLKADMEREMKRNGRAYGQKWEEYWDTDWDILTQKVLPKKDQFRFVPRSMVRLGQYETAQGRVDRCSIEVRDGVYNWGYTLKQAELIDAHCENHNPSSPDKWRMVRELLVQVFGELPEWMDGYVAEHYKKYGR